MSVDWVGDVAAGVFMRAGGGAEGGLPDPFAANLLLGPHGVFERAGPVGRVDVAEEGGEVGGGVVDGVGDGPVPGSQHFVGGGLDVADGPAGDGEAVEGGKPAWGDPSAPIGMGCRMYATPSGLAGTPMLSDVRQALKRAADRAG